MTKAELKKQEPVIIEKTMKFEVYPHDAPKLMTWVEADAWAKSIGDGWRLPTREELLLMYEKRDEIGGFVTEYKPGSGYAHWYWSCTELRDDSSRVYAVDFTDGQVGWALKDNYSLSSRLLRAELPA